MTARTTVRRVALTLVVLAAAAPLVAPPPASGGQRSTIGADDLLARIETALSLANAGAIAPSPAAMDRVRSALGLPASVRLGTETVAVPADPFLAGLSGSNASDFSEASRHLEALSAEVRSAVSAPPIDDAGVRRALAEAYADVARPSIASRYLGYVRDLVLRAIGEWIQALDASHGIGSVIAWGALLLGLAVVAAALRRLGVGLVPEPTAHGPSGRREIDWRRTADAAIADGDRAAAVVALYHLLLVTLAARGVIPDDPAVTSGECRRAVARSLPRAYPSVAGATESFERVAYGGRPAAVADVEALRGANREVAA